MASVADSTTATTSRPLRLRLRPDLQMRRHFYLNQPRWVIKDPVGLSYFQVHQEEYDVLRLLDGKRSLEDIKEEFERAHAPQMITYQDIQQFVGQAHRSGLVISTAPGQGDQLWLRRRKQRRKKIMSAMLNVFWMRFRGVDPTWVLDRLYPWTAWFFSRPAVIAVLLLVLSALAMVLVQLDLFLLRLPAFQEFFAAGNWLILACTLLLVKVLHELAHGLTCRRVGSECHEIGFMLLVFTPALYCNVSDSWMEPNKWKRAAVGAAGMYVEVFMAAIATFLWWFSEPGPLNHMCLNIMFICSVSTILFNGNPLLRFDGYYILSDIVEIPNLRQTATQVLRRGLLRTCLGIKLPEGAYHPRRRQLFLSIYVIAATIYRWLVVLGILFFLNAVLEPHGLKIVGRMLAMVGLVGLVIVPLWQMVRFFRVPGRMHEVKKHRLLITLGCVAGIVSLVLFVPLPHDVTCSFTVEAHGARTIYVVSPGTLRKTFVKPGQFVAKGDKIARLENPELERSLIQMRGQRDELAARIDDLRLLLFRDPAAALEIERLKVLLDSINQQMDEKEEQLSQLRIAAPVSGQIIPPSFRANGQTGENQLPTWTGWALEDKNIGAFLPEKTEVCRIGDAGRLEAVMLIDQADIELVAVDQMVTLQLESRSGEKLTGKIAKISPRELSEIPASLTKQGGGDIMTEVGPEGTLRPASTVYQARVLINTSSVHQIGLRGTANIRTESRSLGSRFLRYLARTFHFEL